MRDYDPTLGRYIQADPLGLVDGASVYGYVGQNPSNYVDFLGLEKKKYYVRNADGTWRCVAKKVFDRHSRLGRDVRIGGANDAGVARQEARQRFGERRTQHGPHGRGQFSHWQHRNGGRGHIFFGPRGGGVNAMGRLLGPLRTLLIYREFHKMMNPDWDIMCSMNDNCT